MIKLGNDCLSTTPDIANTGSDTADVEVGKKKKKKKKKKKNEQSINIES